MKSPKNKVKVQIKCLPHGEGLPLPEYKTSGAAGFDLPSAIDVIVYPGSWQKIFTGFAVAIPEGYELQIRPRSGLAIDGITIVNTPGTVDSDYRGELIIILINHGKFPFKVTRGMRVAQGVVSPVIHADFEVVDELPISERGTKGFGSTGTS